MIAPSPTKKIVEELYFFWTNHKYEIDGNRDGSNIRAFLQNKFLKVED
jgi:hypothetical protein